VKLSAKFARQETEEARQARIARRRIREDHAAAVRRMLGLAEVAGEPADVRPRRHPNVVSSLSCPDCPRQFSLPMHLGRHLRARHGRTNAG
jgi:hypothetical protein